MRSAQDPVVEGPGRHDGDARKAADGEEFLVTRDDAGLRTGDCRAHKETWIAFDGVAQQAVTERTGTATKGDVVISLEYDRRAAARRAAGTRDGAS